MPHGKPAGVRCAQLTDDNDCALFGDPARPAVCLELKPEFIMCGDNSTYALAYLARLERLSQP